MFACLNIKSVSLGVIAPHGMGSKSGFGLSTGVKQGWRLSARAMSIVL
jgi:hypothetical protein